MAALIVMSRMHGSFSFSAQAGEDDSSSGSGEVISSESSSQSSADARSQFLSTLSDSYNYKDTLIVENTNSPDSVAIVNYFLQARAGIPGIGSGNVVHIQTGSGESISMTQYIATIKDPLDAAIASHDAANPDHPINYIILTKGTPIYVFFDGDPLNYFYYSIYPSVDSLLAACLGKADTGSCDPSPARSGQVGSVTIHYYNAMNNPYFHSNAPFSHAAYNMYLVTHLTGYTVEDVEHLIDHASGTAVGSGEALKQNGLFVLDGRGRGVEQYIESAYQLLLAKGFNAIKDQVAAPILSQHNVLGYWSWGSNAYDMNTNTYPPWLTGNTWGSGSIAETAVSTSARTFDPNSPYAVRPQTLIADLIVEGVAGVKGYVSEPYLSAVAMPDHLFDHYADGYNMAESFYAASEMIHWSDLIVGDPKMFVVPHLPPLNTSPARNELVDTFPIFSWQGARNYLGGIDHYELWVDGVKQGNDIPGNTTSVSPAHFQSGSSHSWYVKAVDGEGGVLTSSGSTFSVATVVSPSLLTDLSETYDNQTLTFKWTPAKSEFGIAKYQLFLDDSCTPILDDLHGTGATLLNMLTFGDHYWFVRAVDGNGNIGSSDVAPFSVTREVAIPYPPDGSIVTTLTPTFFYAQNCIRGSYNFIIANYFGGQPVSITVDCTRPFSVSMPLLLYNHASYMWLAGGLSYIFTIDTDAHSIVVNSPSSGSTLLTATPTFSWEPLEGLLRYQIYIDGSSVMVYKTSDTSVTPSIALSNGTHSWFVSGWDNFGNVVISSLNTFTVAAPLSGSSSSFSSASAVCSLSSSSSLSSSASVPDTPLGASSFSSVPARRSGGGGGAILTPLRGAASASSSAPAARTLHTGMKGSDVSALQNILLKQKIFTGPVTGTYDANTVKAIFKFQQTVGIKPTGIADVSTQQKLQALSVPAVAPKVTAPAIKSFTRTLSIGMQGTDVSALQAYLSAQKFLSGTFKNGTFDQATKTALIAFQKKNKLRQSGMVDSATKLVLNRLIKG